MFMDVNDLIIPYYSPIHGGKKRKRKTKRIMYCKKNNTYSKNKRTRRRYH